MNRDRPASTTSASDRRRPPSGSSTSSSFRPVRRTSRLGPELPRPSTYPSPLLVIDDTPHIPGSPHCLCSACHLRPMFFPRRDDGRIVLPHPELVRTRHDDPPYGWRRSLETEQASGTRQMAVSGFGYRGLPVQSQGLAQSSSTPFSGKFRKNSKTQKVGSGTCETVAREVRPPARDESMGATSFRPSFAASPSDDFASISRRQFNRGSSSSSRRSRRPSDRSRSSRQAKMDDAISNRPEPWPRLQEHRGSSAGRDIYPSAESTAERHGAGSSMRQGQLAGSGIDHFEKVEEEPFSRLLGVTSLSLLDNAGREISLSGSGISQPRRFASPTPLPQSTRSERSSSRPVATPTPVSDPPRVIRFGPGNPQPDTWGSGSGSNIVEGEPSDPSSFQHQFHTGLLRFQDPVVPESHASIDTPPGTQSAELSIVQVKWDSERKRRQGYFSQEEGSEKSPFRHYNKTGVDLGE